ncbi:hypothetical protein KFU94_05115 [Chloroflexi bacterium TSY]|nr:hypothetical protein [Chloroflexi bacterium TSY]
MDRTKRKRNERKYGQWQSRPENGRRYWYDVPGRHGWLARYVKEVDADENTVRFYQEIFNEEGKLVEIHEKYPVDKGHQPVDTQSQ